MQHYRGSLPWRVFCTISGMLDRRWGWSRLPKPVALAVLVGLRTSLRRQNLHDTDDLPTANGPDPPVFEDSHRTQRTSDGSWNDLSRPQTGMAGARFGRNVPLGSVTAVTPADVLTPSPREVSRRLMTRRQLDAAEGVNSLVAAWLQFMIHDWFSHGESPQDEPWVVQLADDDDWHERPMTILRTPDDPTRADGGRAAPRTSVNVLTHWWDGSSLYGTSSAETAARRSFVDGKLTLESDGSLPRPTDPAKDPAQVPGFWLGLGLLATVFTHEHNAICDRLKADQPTSDDEQLFQRARLINAALLAKIHTVEWTPAVISHPTAVAGLRANWWGLAGERASRLFGRISRHEEISGIPGSRVDHYGIPYSLTEEFAAVYRMHPLLRDDWSLRAVADDTTLRECTFRDISGPAGADVLRDLDTDDLLYSFGTQPPGLVSLHNYPRFLQEYERPDGRIVDLAATDIVRTREMGVPRYNEFRRLLHLNAFPHIEAMTDNPAWATEISDVYGGDVEKVDLSVGLFAERRPKGFAFSDTAFRIFVLMASRRLNSDRFLTDYYTPAVYTQAGLDWIADSTMADVLRRHHPRLAPALDGLTNAFAAWHRTRAPEYRR
jgi:hypothetical protein